MDRADLARLREALDQDVRDGLLYVTSWSILDAHRILLYIAKLEARIQKKE